LNSEDAIAPLGSALTVDPSNMQVRTLLGLSFYGAKHFSGAVKYLEPVAKSDLTNKELPEVLAQSCLSAKNYSCALDAMIVLQRAVKLDPAHQPDAHFRLKRLYQAMGNTLAAQKEFARVRELHEKEDENVAAKMSAAPPPLPQ